MKEIEFRGYSKRFGRWLIGFLIGDNKIREFGIPDKGHEVLHISQYTGLKDKNGRKIFEGDIVNAQYFFENYDPYTLGAFEDEGEITGKIIFDLDGFRIVDKDDEGREVGLSMIEDSEVQMEVIGNIWDNPELLEGKDE